MNTDLIIAFIQGFLFSLSLCFDLGMVNVAIIKTGIERGLKPSFLIGFGSCFGDLIYLLLALFGFTFIFQISMVKWVLWIVGTIVLLYLTYKMIKDTVKPKVIDTSQVSVTNRSSFKDILFGAGAALASPTSILWFAIVGGPIVAAFQITEPQILLSFLLGFFIAGLVWSLSVAILSSQTGKLMGMKFIRGISFISALIFLYFAIKVFLDGLKTIQNL